MGSEENAASMKHVVSSTSTTMDTRPVVLLTGFGPFANYKENPAWLALQALEKRSDFDLPVEKIKFVFRLIPVEYETVKNVIPALWDELKPQAIIHVGAGMADGSIHLEKRAFNKGYCCKDIQGSVPCDNCCASDGPFYLETELDLDVIIKEVNSKLDGILQPAKLSSNPGRYLCGFIYYQSLHRYSRRNLFIHVPPIDDGTGGGCVTAEKLAQSLRLVILAVITQLGLTNQ